MSLRRRFVLRLHRALVYWGLLHHPFGREYVREHYTPTGGTRGDADGSAGSGDPTPDFR